MWTGMYLFTPLLFATEAIDKYPAYDSFLHSVREEAVQNVKRLRHHPSVVIFGASHVFFTDFSEICPSVVTNSWK